MKEGYIIHVQNVRFIVYIENMLKQDNTQYAANRNLYNADTKGDRGEGSENNIQHLFKKHA